MILISKLVQHRIFRICVETKVNIIVDRSQMIIV